MTSQANQQSQRNPNSPLAFSYLLTPMELWRMSFWFLKESIVGCMRKYLTRTEPRGISFLLSPEAIRLAVGIFAVPEGSEKPDSQQKSPD